MVDEFEIVEFDDGEGDVELELELLLALEFSVEFVSSTDVDIPSVLPVG